MKDIINAIEDKIVHRNNTLRFQLSHLMEAAFKNSIGPVEYCRFLKNTMDLSLSVSKEIYDRLCLGESFTDITNDLNTRKLL